MMMIKKESDVGTIEGLKLLDIESKFQRTEKIVTQSEAVIPEKEDLTGIAGAIFAKIAGEKVTGYEIHEGTSHLNPSKEVNPLLNVQKGQGNNDEGNFDGACSGNVFGTYFHGIFHNYNFRREFLNYLRVRKGIEAKNGEDPYETQKDYSLNKLAQIVEENIDMEIIDKLIFHNIVNIAVIITIIFINFNFFFKILFKVIIFQFFKITFQITIITFKITFGKIK